MPPPNQFDEWLQNDGPAALVIREHLMPVDGPDGVLFPATFAAGDGFPGGYNIDTFPDGTNVCLIDSVGSQANRIEPLFMQAKYKELVPQIIIKAGDKEVNLLEAGHRAGDAIVRCSELQQTLQDAFKALLQGNAEPLAKIAPTSLVFGVWDSRGTQAKVPRLSQPPEGETLSQTSAILALLSFPVLLAGGILLLFDRLGGTSFFIPAGLVVSDKVIQHAGGSPPFKRGGGVAQRDRVNLP